MSKIQAEEEMSERLKTSVEGVNIFITEGHLKTKLEKDSKKYAFVLFVPRLDEWSDHVLETLRNCKDPLTEADDYLHIDGDDPLPWHSVESKRKYVLDKLREFADHIKWNKKIENRVQFYITFKDSAKDNFICHYSVYEGLLENF